MSPLVLKLQQEDQDSFNFTNLNQDELSKTWRVCTKVKDSLENGSRLENLSWRLWFRQNVTLAKEAERKQVERERQVKELENQQLLQQQIQLQMQQVQQDITATTTNSNTSLNSLSNLNSFTLNQFTSDQAEDQMIELTDIFLDPFDPAYMPTYYPYLDMPVDNSLFDLTETVPNVTLYNKVLATLPKETLESAERLLTPQQEEKKTIEKKREKEQPTHYYSTFKVSPLQRTSSSHATHSNAATYPESDQQAICDNCKTNSTPFWRRSDDQILCNACGLYLKLHNEKRPHKVNISPSSSSTVSHYAKKDGTICSNCGTSETPLWRRDVEGSPLCNACGLYLKLHNARRPLSMKTDIIKKRQRTESLLANEEDKRPRYIDQKSLSIGHPDSALPGTGILMMSNNCSKQ